MAKKSVKPETGNLQIHSENILPIIKKWLYSDMDIFARELVSNGVDAITKLQKLMDMGEAPPCEEAFAVRVKVDKDAKTITLADNGIGMTADEVREYINQIAFSGASAFIEKYKAESAPEIIGHFGLGFYSSFMVADRVRIDTLSYREGAAPAGWECEGGIEYTMGESTRTTRGTTITLFIGEAGEEFLDEWKLRAVLTKYCGFMPVPIFVGDPPEPKEGEEEPPAHTPINDTAPLWLKPAAECTDEEYKAFYSKVFTDFNEPLFWIHLNMDYPFRLKGILYFPKLKHDLEYMEGQVKLFNNQVFVADNIKEVIPEYLLLLKGMMDCPDLPLNVSRSFLQNDKTVRDMGKYISRKVADKLNSLFKKDREKYASYWSDIAPFIKYGCIKERELYDKIKASVLYKTTKGEYKTLEELTASLDEKKIFYVTDEQLQAQYIQMFDAQGLTAILMGTNLDAPYMSYLETYEPEVKFARIDADITGELKDESDEEMPEGFAEKLQGILGDEKLTVSVEKLKSDEVSAVMLLSEQSRRMQEMSKMFGGGTLPPGMFTEELTLVLNKNHALVGNLLHIFSDESRTDDVELMARHLYDLAMLTHKPLSPAQMTEFIRRSNKILELATRG